ncbi:VWA domain-containing protein [Rhizobiaceae bacterium BDR2-2]|uniref:VWA domain-containing protein n=1 Tax=Ectorhizobium quercum TaxID=2965071 RepID=A0AAE3SY81_9HYPH|nr:VWA domain-containing protein [Ectorhizobium quercum]MCX8999894.1 VWA domain-containing protein [Ectorhizobium quercum]
MTFIWTEMLWLLLLLPVLAGLYIFLLRRRKKMALRYANLSIVKQAVGARGRWRRHVPPALFLIAMTALILAVARPAAVMTLASSRATVILAMDTSGSMRAEDVEPTRIEAAQAAARQFIADQPGNVQIGIVSFASSAVLVQQPTIDREALYGAIDRFQLRHGTAVGSGVLMSLATIFPEERFESVSEFSGSSGQAARPPGYSSRSLDEPAAAADAPPHEPVEPGSYDNAVIILLTDGATTTGPDPIKAGQTAADYGVRVFTVGFGSPSGEIVNYAGRSMRAHLDADSLKNIAETTRGQYFEARTSDDLTDVYRSMSSQLITEKKLTEVSFIFAGVGALFALAAAGLSTLWFNRVF